MIELGKDTLPLSRQSWRKTSAKRRMLKGVPSYEKLPMWGQDGRPEDRAKRNELGEESSHRSNSCIGAICSETQNASPHITHRGRRAVLFSRSANAPVHIIQVCAAS
jgi:hypothetical protein